MVEVMEIIVTSFKRSHAKKKCLLQMVPLLPTCHFIFFLTTLKECLSKFAVCCKQIWVDSPPFH